MRMRKKPWARPELEAAGYVITEPDKYKGMWKEEFKNDKPIYLELGCGTGKFIGENAANNPDINYIGIDVKDEVLVYAKRSIEDNLGLKDGCVGNVRLIPMEIAFIEKIFDKDEISRIYINFCNPWPKLRHNKRRLTHTKFLNKYKTFLKPSSQIWFKTDDKDLFESSQEYFKENGFDIIYLTYDLHQSGFEPNIMTEYETRYTSLGMPIMFIIAQMK